MSLEEKLDMGILKEIKNYVSARNRNDAEINLPRRDFIKNAGLVGAALAVGGPSALYSETVLARNAKNPKLPPGFWPETCSSDELIEIFEVMYPATGNNPIGDMFGKNHQSRIRDKLSFEINPNVPLTEPAYWFAIEYYNYKWQINGKNGIIDMNRAIMKTFKNLEKTNPPMYNWAFGISKYFQTWVAEIKTGTPTETEIYLLKAIFTAAGRNENVINDYRTLDLSNKERFLQNIMKDLEKQKKTNQLIAAWSSFFLTSNYYNLTNSKNKESDLYYYNFQKPLLDKKIIPNIRGNYNL